MAIRVIAFDVFGTIFDLSNVDKQEIRDYIAHIKQPEWTPLHLPDSWARLPTHDDAYHGLQKLRGSFSVVTCSNGPVPLLVKLSKNNGIEWDAVIPIHMNRVYKPNPKAYLTVCEVMWVQPSEVLMVTANEKFGDIEAAEALGMRAALIERPGRTIIDLANELLFDVPPPEGGK